jgi:hypothetical protein
VDSKMSVEQCRELLGEEANGWTDDKVGRWRDRVANMAHLLLPVMKKVSRDDLEAMRWAAFAVRNGPMEELTDTRGDEFDDLEPWPGPEGPCRVN